MLKNPPVKIQLVASSRGLMVFSNIKGRLNVFAFHLNGHMSLILFAPKTIMCDYSRGISNLDYEI